MKITLDRKDQAQVEMVKLMASKDRNEAYDAQLAVATLLGPVLAEVINNAPTLSNLFSTFSYDEDDNPSIPVDLYYDILDEDYIKVYSQGAPGGLPTNHVQPTFSELKFVTYTLDTAISFDKKYAQRSRLDVVGKSMTRLAQEILLKQETTSANLLLTALANAQTNGTDDSDRHVSRSAQADRFLLEDINKLFTKMKRINTSWVNGTPAGQRRGLTDLIVSPEIVEQIRSMAYNPINTVDSDGSASSGADSGLAAPSVIREKLFSQSGFSEFFGVSIMEINELGDGRKWNSVFDTLAGATTYDNHGSTSASSVFAGASEQIIIGLDKSRESLLRAVQIGSENGSEFSLTPDDQFSDRQKRIGFWGGLEEGRMVLDDRALVGLIV
jgi:hypothetical protein